MKKRFDTLFEAWGVVELIGALLFVALGPFVWMYRLGAAGRSGMLAVVAAAWVASVVIISRDLLFQRTYSVSLVVVVAWYTVLAFAILTS